jgi:hypothetical protein
VKRRLIVEYEEVLEATNDKVEVAMARLDNLLYLISDLFKEVMDLAKVNVLQTEPSLRNTMNQLFHTCYQLKVVYRTLPVDTYLDALAFPLVLLPEVFRWHEPNCNQELSSITRLKVIRCDILVD